MHPKILNARWTIDGIGVPYTDYFSVLMFQVYVRRLAMHIPLPESVKSSFKNRSSEMKSKYNYKFKNL
jgi:hypothetical protein